MFAAHTSHTDTTSGEPASELGQRLSLNKQDNFQLYPDIFSTSLSFHILCCAFVYLCVFTEALGDFDEPQRSSMTMFGVLTIAVRIYQDRWGYGIYSGPIGSAVFIITVKWVSVLSPSLERKSTIC